MTSTSSVTPAAVWGTKLEFCSWVGQGSEPAWPPGDSGSQWHWSSAGNSKFTWLLLSLLVLLTPSTLPALGTRRGRQWAEPLTGHSGQTRTPARECGTPGAGSTSPPPANRHKELSLPEPSTQATGLPKTASTERERSSLRTCSKKTRPANDYNSPTNFDVFSLCFACAEWRHCKDLMAPSRSQEGQGSPHDPGWAPHRPRKDFVLVTPPKSSFFSHHWDPTG